MDDFAALAETLSAGVGDARGALILSRDGLVLGAHPVDAESLVKPAWLRFAALGDPERGFLQFGIEIWSYVRRGPYAAFVVTGTSVRPGLVLDLLEQVLLSAEEARAKREGLRPESVPPPPAAAPMSKPRTPLHPEPKPVDRSMAIHAEVPAAPVAEHRAEAPTDPPSPAPATPEMPPVSEPPLAAAQAEGTGPEAPAGAPERPKAPRGSGSMWVSEEGADDEEVDRFSLAREFSQLLQQDNDGADG